MWMLHIYIYLTIKCHIKLFHVMSNVLFPITGSQYINVYLIVAEKIEETSLLTMRWEAVYIVQYKLPGISADNLCQVSRLKKVNIIFSKTCIVMKLCLGM
jgi:hypothetical protein